MKSYKIYIDSANLLCESNLLGLSMICRYMEQNGHKITKDPSQADFIIINSCGFTKNFEDKSVGIYNENYPKKRKEASIIMYGCLVKINKKTVDSLDLNPIDFEEIEKFDKIFFNNTKFKDIKPYSDTKKLEDLFFNRTIIQPTKIIPVFLTRLLMPFSKKLRINYEKIVNNLISKNKILIEICRGCASNCNYCVIKKTKGGIRSRPINDIIDDIDKVYDPSKELFLVADDCSCYGMDLNTNLNDLLKEVKKKYPNLLIDMDNINPFWLEKNPDQYYKLFSEYNISYATIPVQSGSNKILKDMNRIYDVKKIREITKKIKKISPTTAVYTHFIICYPKENFLDYLKSIFYSLDFDLPIFFVYSEHKDSAKSNLSELRYDFNKSYRMAFSILFLNFIVLYKLLTLSINKKTK